MSAILRISIWGIVALILAAVLVIGLSGGNVFQDLIFGDFSIGNSFTFADAEEYTADGASLPVGASMDAIEIDWVAGKVNLRFTDTARIVFTEQANRDLKEHERLQYRLKNGRLSIQYCAPYRSLFSSMPSKTLEVEVPRAMRLANIRVNSVSAAVRIEGVDVSLQAIALETVSGPMTMEGLSAARLNVDTVSGGVTISGAFEEIETESVSGGMGLRLYGMPRRLNADTVSGSIRLSLPENEGFTATLSSVSGSITCDFPAILSRKKVVYGNGFSQFTLSTVSGSATIEMDESLGLPGKAPSPAPSSAPSAAPAPTRRDEPALSGGRKF